MLRLYPKSVGKNVSVDILKSTAVSKGRTDTTVATKKLFSALQPPRLFLLFLPIPKWRCSSQARPALPLLLQAPVLQLLYNSGSSARPKDGGRMFRHGSKKPLNLLENAHIPYPLCLLLYILLKNSPFPRENKIARECRMLEERPFQRSGGWFRGKTKRSGSQKAALRFFIQLLFRH